MLAPLQAAALHVQVRVDEPREHDAVELLRLVLGRERRAHLVDGADREDAAPVHRERLGVGPVGVHRADGCDQQGGGVVPGGRGHAGLLGGGGSEGRAAGHRVGDRALPGEPNSSSVRSARYGPTNCTPIGSPSVENEKGSDSAGIAVAVMRLQDRCQA